MLACLTIAVLWDDSCGHGGEDAGVWTSREQRRVSPSSRPSRDSPLNTTRSSVCGPPPPPPAESADFRNGQRPLAHATDRAIRPTAKRRRCSDKGGGRPRYDGNRQPVILS